MSIFENFERNFICYIVGEDIENQIDSLLHDEFFYNFDYSEACPYFLNIDPLLKDKCFEDKTTTCKLKDSKTVVAKCKKKYIIPYYISSLKAYEDIWIEYKDTITQNKKFLSIVKKIVETNKSSSLENIMCHIIGEKPNLRNYLKIEGIKVLKYLYKPTFIEFVEETAIAVIPDIVIYNGKMYNYLIHGVTECYDDERIWVKNFSKIWNKILDDDIITIAHALKRRRTMK